MQQLTKLELLYLHNNDFESLPNLSNLPFQKDIGGATAGLRIFGNRLTFKDVLPNIPLAVKSTFIYQPQDSIFRDTTITRIVGQTLTIDLGIDAGLSTNAYQWYKNGSLWTPPAGNTGNSNKLIFNTLQASDAGTYHVRVTNPGAAALTLYSRAINILVQCAPKSNTILPAQVEVCTGRGVLLDAGIWNTYAWSDGSTTQTLLATNSGFYQITVTDTDGCTVTDTVQVVQLPRPDIKATVTPAGCTVSNGSIVLDVSGGTPPYSYNWQDLNIPNEPRDRTGLPVGNYRVTATDMNGCSWQAVNIPVNVTTNLPG